MSHCPADRQGLQHCIRLPCGMTRVPGNDTGGGGGGRDCCRCCGGGSNVFCGGGAVAGAGRAAVLGKAAMAPDPNLPRGLVGFAFHGELLPPPTEKLLFTAFVWFGVALVLGGVALVLCAQVRNTNTALRAVIVALSAVEINGWAGHARGVTPVYVELCVVNSPAALPSRPASRDLAFNVVRGQGVTSKQASRLKKAKLTLRPFRVCKQSTTRRHACTWGSLP